MNQILSGNIAAPFLTLTAHPAIGAVLLDSRPSWVWNSEGNRILWANAAGVSFFGETSMEALLDRSFGDVHPAKRHLARLAENAPTGAPMLDKLHFFLGETAETASCLCKRLKVESEDVLLVVATDRAEEKLDEESHRKALLDLFSAPGTAQAAILDTNGSVMAAAGQDYIDLNDASLRNRLVAEADGPSRMSSDTVVKQDTTILATVARVGEETSRCYLFLAHDPTNHPIETDVGVVFDEIFGADGEPVILDDDLSSADIFGADFLLDPDIFDANRQPSLSKDSDFTPFTADADREITADGSKQAEALDATDGADGSENKVTNLAERRSPAFSPRNGLHLVQDTSEAAIDNVVSLSQYSGPTFSDTSNSMGSNGAVSDKAPTFEFDSKGGVLHFVWESDEVGRITQVSQELADAVGPSNAEITGMSWPEIAERLDLDHDRAVARAFETRDTWTGLIVNWPVEGQDLRVPVELTGLPVFGRFHGFQGFRGFGVCDVSKAELAAPSTSNGNGVDAPSEMGGDDHENLPQFDDKDILVSDQLLAAAQNAVMTAQSIVGADAEINEGSSNSKVTEEFVQDLVDTVSDETEPKDMDSSDDQHEIAASSADETPSVVTRDEPSDPYHLVHFLLSGQNGGVKEHDGTIIPETSDEIRSSGKGNASLSEDEKDAFEEIATILEDHPESTDLPNDLDEDYEEFERQLQAEAVLISDEDNGPSNEPEPQLQTAATQETSDRKPQRTLSSNDDALRMATSSAFREIFALDPSFARLKDRLDTKPTASKETLNQQDQAAAAANASEPTAQTVEPTMETEAASAPEQDVEQDMAAIAKALSENEISQVEDHAEVADQSVANAEASKQMLGNSEDTEEASTSAEVALAAATVSGIAALGGASLWDNSDTASPLIDLLNKLPNAIVVSADNDILFASRTALRLLGFASASELAAAGGMAELFTGRPGDWLTKTDGRTTLRTAEGARISVLASISSINWGDRPAAMLSFEEDKGSTLLAGVSEEDEKIAELEAILDTATDGVIVVDGACQILRMNHSAEALFAVDRHDVAGDSFLDLLNEESHKSALDYFHSVKQNGVATVLLDGCEVNGKSANNVIVPLTLTIGRVAVPGTDHFCIVLRDMSQWKQTHETLVAEKVTAEDASKQKSDFLAKVSHEIRTPLNSIIGFSDVMIEERFGPLGSDRYRDYLKDIRMSGKHIVSLLNDLLDLSKVEAGKMELQFEAVGLNRLVSECVGLLQTQANRQQIIVRTSLASYLPNVAADDRSLKQVVLNLLSNGLKFTEPGGQVIVSTRLEDNGKVVLRLRDTGIGMTEDELKSALEPFRQISNIRGNQEGSGLGLPLTKALVEANHAQFSISSVKDTGTMVEVSFPSERVIAEQEVGE